MPCLGSSLVSLVISSSPFGPSLKPPQWAPPARGQESFFPFQTAGFRLLPAGPVLRKLPHDQRNQNFIDGTSLWATCSSGEFSCPFQCSFLPVMGLRKTPPVLPDPSTNWPSALNSFLMTLGLLSTISSPPTCSTNCGNNQRAAPDQAAS